MRKEEYVKSVKVGNIKVDVGIDDYGQCYFFEYLDNGELKEVCCGSYNLLYMEEIASYFNVKVEDICQLPEKSM